MENYKEMRMYTLRGDVYTCGVDGMTKFGIRKLLKERYVNLDEILTIDEFNDILDAEYKKVIAWRERNASK